MKVHELITELQKLNQNTNVVIDVPNDKCYDIYTVWQNNDGVEDGTPSYSVIELNNHAEWQKD